MEIPRILDQLRRAWDGDAWHGPSVQEVLSGIDAQAASRRPLAAAHTIAEIALHIGNWEDNIRRRLEQKPIGVAPNEEDWPAVPEGPEGWEAIRRRLDEAHAGLERAIGAIPESQLGDPVQEKDYTLYVMLHGIVQHTLYHAGQIALLKKAVA